MLGYKYAEMSIFLSLQKTGDTFCKVSKQSPTLLIMTYKQYSDFLCVCAMKHCSTQRSTVLNDC